MAAARVEAYRGHQVLRPQGPIFSYSVEGLKLAAAPLPHRLRCRSWYLNGQLASGDRSVSPVCDPLLDFSLSGCVAECIGPGVRQGEAEFCMVSSTA